MPPKPKRKGKKRNPALSPETQRRVTHLQNLQQFLEVQEKEYSNYLQGLTISHTEEIRKLYKDALSGIDENIRNMTAAQIQEMMETRAKEEQEKESSISVNDKLTQIERFKKLETEKKQTAKKTKKRSISTSSSNKLHAFAQPSAKILSSVKKAASETDLFTPATKRLDKMSNVITPKFDMKGSFVSQFARKPKAGEMIVSLSGSPLKNVIDEKLPADNVQIGFFNGNIVTLNIKAVEEKAKHFEAQTTHTLDTIMDSIKQRLVSTDSQSFQS